MKYRVKFNLHTYYSTIVSADSREEAERRALTKYNNFDSEKAIIENIVRDGDTDIEEIDYNPEVTVNFDYCGKNYCFTRKLKEFDHHYSTNNIFFEHYDGNRYFIILIWNDIDGILTENGFVQLGNKNSTYGEHINSELKVTIKNNICNY